MSSSRPARKASTKRQYVEIDEDEDEQDKKSERYKSGSDATAEDGVDSSEEEDDELTLGAEVHSHCHEHLAPHADAKLARKTAAKFMAPSASQLRAV
jgi:hypothetical protein